MIITLKVQALTRANNEQGRQPNRQGWQIDWEQGKVTGWIKTIP